MFFGDDGLVTVDYSGGKALAYATDDGGRTWIARGGLTTGGWPDFADAMDGWQTDGLKIHRTRDGGMTWQPLEAGPALQSALADHYISQLDFVDSQHGWAALASKTERFAPVLLVTGDGGNTWSEPAFECGVDESK